MHVVGIGSPVEYLGRDWRVGTITKRFVVLDEIKGGEMTGRTTRVDLPVFERVASETAKGGTNG